MTHIKITDEDYFDVDFSFEGLNADPKAIYIKRKHFKDINPKALNPENVLNTNIVQNQIKANLEQESRYLAFIDQESKPKPKALNYLLPQISAHKLKSVCEALKPPQR